MVGNRKRVVRGVWKEIPPDFRYHQLSSFTGPPVYWPAFWFHPLRRNYTKSVLVRWEKFYGWWYYLCCISMLVLGFFNSMTRCDYTIPIVVIGLIGYWMKDFEKEKPNYFSFEWPNYYHTKEKEKWRESEPNKLRIFYLGHCIVACELFLVSLVFSIVLDVLWIAVHGDYLRDYGYLPLMVDFSIKAIVRIHKVVLGFSICQLLLKLFSIYWIVCYIKVLNMIMWYIIPAKGVQPAQFKEPAPPPPRMPMPAEPPPPKQEVSSPSVHDL